jgi:glutaredoxin 3
MRKVRIFSTPSCPYCLTLKEYLKGQSIVFEDIDVSQDKNALDEMVEKSNQMGVPVVDIDGQIVVGFDKEKINQLLNIKE